jgi:hypothetical protein
MAFEVIKQIAQDLRAIDLVQVSLDAMQKNESVLISFNQAQLQNSIDREGEALGEYASIEYANKKGRIDVDLRLKGGFYGGMFVNAEKYPVVFDSSDSKTLDLKLKYGEEIFGTTPGNTKKVAFEIVLPECQGRILKAFQL